MRWKVALTFLSSLIAVVVISQGTGTTKLTASDLSPTYVQSHWASASTGDVLGVTNTLLNTLPNTTPGGHFLLVWLDWDCGPEFQETGCDTVLRTFQSVTDDINNKYTQLDIERGYLGDLGGSDTTRLYWAVNRVEGTRTVKFVTSNARGHFIGSFITEYQGTDPTKPIDTVTWTRYLISTGTINPSSAITTSARNETVVGILGGGGSRAPSAGPGWTLQSNGPPNPADFPFGLEDRPILTPSMVTVPWVDSEAQGYGLWNVALNPAH